MCEIISISRSLPSRISNTVANLNDMPTAQDIGNIVHMCARKHSCTNKFLYYHSPIAQQSDDRRDQAQDQEVRDVISRQ